MEFLKAYEQAQTMGLTKQEFLIVWESESKLKQRIQEGEAKSQYGDNKQASQNQTSDGHGSSVDPGVLQFKQDVYRLRHEVKDLHFMPEDPFKQLVEKQEQLWQQMNLKYDQLKDEMVSHFEILTHHISNVADSQANSLKLYFMHEIDLLKQDLRRLIEEQNIKQETSLMSSQQIGLVSSQDLSPQQNSSSCGQPENVVSSQIETKSKPKKNRSKSKNKHPQQNQQLHQGDMPEPGIDCQIDGDSDIFAPNGQRIVSGNKKSFPETVKDLPFKSYANVAALSTKAEKVPSNYASDRVVGTSNLCASSVVNLKGSLAATGLMADVIASQMKHKQSSQASSVKSRASSVKSSTRSENSGSVKISPVEKKTKPGVQCSLPAGNSKQYAFTITNNSYYIDSHKQFLSPYVYSKGKACKARVSLRDEEVSGQLIVHVHLSKGLYDDSHKWPLILTGNGYIYNPGSKRLTPLWHLEPAVAQKPWSSEGELIFPAVVCLMTSKRNHNDVTYAELVKRYKAGEDCLMFSWDLKATEGQKNPQT